MTGPRTIARAAFETVDKLFDRAFTPIGLDIGAVTVPEIATSITAELIAVRRRGINHKPSNTTEPT